MADATTVYDIKVRYNLEGAERVRSKFATIISAAKALKRAGAEAQSQIAGVFNNQILRQGISMGKSWLIDFNAEVEQSRIGLQTMISLNLGKPFAEAQGDADKFFQSMQQAAKRSPGTTQDFIAMGQGIAPSLLAAGRSMADLERFTIGAMTAASAFGIRGDMMALDVQQALNGTTTARDRIMMLLRAQGITDPKEFNKLAAPERFRTLERLFNSKTLKDASEAQGASFSGQVSSFKDNLQIAAGKVGLPLFKRLTAEVASWNTWIDSNQAKIQVWADKFGISLVNGFNTVKSIAAFIVSHADTFMSLAKLWIGLKLGGGALAPLAALIPQLNGVAAAAGAVVIGLWGLGKVLDLIGGESNVQVAMRERKKADTGVSMGIRRDAGAMYGQTKYAVDRAQFDAWSRAQVAKTRNAGADRQRSQVRSALDKLTQNALNEAAERKRKTNADRAGKPADVNVQVNIQRLVSEHPDRFAMGLSRAAAETAANPSQADTAWSRHW